MHPDRRRAGRAIRKARRETREAAASFDWLAFAETLRPLVDAWSAFATAVVGAVERAAEAMSAFLTAVFMPVLPSPQRAICAAPQRLAITA